MLKQIASISLVSSLIAAGLTFSDIGGTKDFAAASPAVPAMPTFTEHESEPLPMPVSQGPLIDVPEGEAQGDASACIAANHMLSVLALDVQHVGGEVLLLSGGLEQAFADSWRHAVGLPSVQVSQVFAHVVKQEDGNGVVDVIEIGSNGCALSRTLLAIDDWLFIMKPLESVEV